MFLDPITAPEIDIRKAFSPAARILKSRQRQCPPHLVSLPMVDSLGRHTTYCVKPPPSEMLHDPFYAAKRDIAGTTHLARIPGLAQHHVIAIGGAIPDRTTLGEKITRYRHPLQHLGDDVHIIEKHPDSDALGHTPPQAYQYAVSKLLVRGQAGEPYGIGEVIARDAQGKPTRYRLHRDRKYTFTGRISAADRKDHPRGSGIDLWAAQFEYLQEHPPEVSVETTPSGEVFATHSRMLFPPVDADGHPIAGRPLEARHEIKLHPVVYGGEQAFRALGLTPHRKFEGSEKDAGRAFLTYLEQARRKFFAREADRAPSGSVEELLRQHNGNVDQLVMSGDLGHENVALPPTERRKQHWVRAKKPIGEREIDQLVLRWRAQHPALIDSIKAEVARQHPVLRGDAAIDNAIDAGIANAIHRYDPKRGDFARFARQTAVGQAFDEARARGVAYGAEVYPEGEKPIGPYAPEDADEAPPEEDAAEDDAEDTADDAAGDEGDGYGEDATGARARARSRRRPRPSRQAERAAAYQAGGSKAEFDKVLAAALPDDELARRAISAMHPTGDFPAGVSLRDASQQSGLPIETLQRYRPLIERIKAHPAYRPYHERHLRVLDERRRDQDLSRGLPHTAPRPARLHSALVAIRGEERLTRIVKHQRGQRRAQP